LNCGAVYCTGLENQNLPSGNFASLEERLQSRTRTKARELKIGNRFGLAVCCRISWQHHDTTDSRPHRSMLQRREALQRSRNREGRRSCFDQKLPAKRCGRNAKTFARLCRTRSAASPASRDEDTGLENKRASLRKGVAPICAKLHVSQEWRGVGNAYKGLVIVSLRSVRQDKPPAP
jgi:hypothetical protein